MQSGHWTLDNLQANDTTLEFLQKALEEREITSFNAKDNRVMCFPHIINIAVQHVLSRMSSVKASEGDHDDLDIIDQGNDDECHGAWQTFESACAQDPIRHLCNIVITIQSSGQRRDTFMSWIKSSNKNGWFMSNGNPVQIIPRQLLRDVCTQWDSTYQMIKRCIEMHLVCFQVLFSNLFAYLYVF